MILKNVLVLTGSIHKQGTSLLLADKFEKNAPKKSGNKIKRYDTLGLIKAAFIIAKTMAIVFKKMILICKM